MAVPLDQFVKHLEDSGILAGDTLKEFLPPKSTPKDAQELARELILQKKLTKFQAEAVIQGNGKSLVLDNYVLLEKIGQGGMGQVFKAEHLRMHRIVAVKVLPTSMMKNAATVARFQREVQAAARISHPNIVTAFDAGHDGGVHFLVMEFVEGSDLSALVKKNGPFPVEQALNFILQAARGLEAAHAEGIIHRDIKPANLLLDKEGTVKILDMGLARLSADADTGQQADLTNTGTVMGTVDYMSPEQALDTKAADARADIYSLGCTLFYLLTGKAIYQGDTLMKKLLAHRELPIPSIRAVRPQVSEQIEVVLSKMVAKNIEDRYQTMSEVLADLERCSAGRAASFNTQQLFGYREDEGLADFLKDISHSEAEPILRKKSAGPSFGNDRKQLMLIGGGMLGVLLLAGLIVSLRTKDVASEAGGKQAITAKPAPVNGRPVAIQRVAGGFEVVAPRYRAQVSSNGLLQKLEAGGATLIESTSFGGIGSAGAVTAKQSGATLTFQQASDYRLHYEFEPASFTLKARVSEAAARRDAVDGKVYFIFYDVLFPEDATSVRRLDFADEFELPAMEEGATTHFAVSFSSGAELEITSPPSEARFNWAGVTGPYRWGHPYLTIGDDNFFRFDIRKGSATNGSEPPRAILPKNGTG